MKLSSKLFLSYLLVVAVGLLVLALSTAVVAPVTFAESMGRMGAGGPQRGMSQERLSEINEQVEVSFRSAVDDALLRASVAAVVAALIASWLVSQQIVRPLRALVTLSRRIAGGHYQERLASTSHDELAELIDSFNQMAAALEHSEALRRELLADVTHELKTPLASIRGYMEGLQDGVIPASAETYQLIHREASRLQRLVQDLQELSRAEAGQVPIHRQKCDLEPVVAAAVERLRPQFAEKLITLTTTLPPALPAVNIDPDRVGQVLTNLLGNALQYTPEGGSVAVSVLRGAGELAVTVRDSGAGIAPENLDRIFQRFFRVDKSRARSSGGSGIGLTISRYLVEAHGGRIWAESAGLGQGSSFHFTLPTT